MSKGGATKRAWKLQEFVAHAANVNCLALGHKSGRVLVTGGDDKKVNLWAVGKPNCIMSLCGHTTPVECVRFGHTEELVCAGSSSGALKIWDLEAARLVRTLTGHKSGLTCVDFHPYGDFLSSGSHDTNLKLWDIRRKGCIFTYKGHRQKVNSVKFSPDGQWIASAGEEGAVKIWDLRAGKLMTEFDDHSGPVNDVEFHPHEFLLASASNDRHVNFWDLEQFKLVSSSERDSGPVRCITYHSANECLFSASPDSFKVHLWEPHRTVDSILMGWGKIRDIAVASTQLIGAAYNMSSVAIYVVDLKRVEPLGCPSSRTERLNGRNVSAGGNRTNMRRSFAKGMAGNASAQVKVEEQNSDERSGTEEDSDNAAVNAAGMAMAGAANGEMIDAASINDYNGYQNIFRPRRRELNRTPPAEDEPFQAPMSGSESESSNSRPSHIRLQRQVADANSNPLNLAKKGMKKQPSPSPTRRSSHPVRMRKTSTNSASNGGSSSPTSNSSQPQPLRPSSVYHESAASSSSPVAAQRNQRATSVQPRSSSDLNYATATLSGGDISPTHGDHSSLSSSSSSGGRSSSLNRRGQTQPEFTPLTPVSRIQIGPDGQSGRPLDRPAQVRPGRSSLQHDAGMYHQQHLQQQQQPQHYADLSGMRASAPASRLSQPDLSMLHHQEQMRMMQQQQQQQQRLYPASPSKSYYNSQQQHQQQQPYVAPFGHHASSQLEQPEREKFEVIPMNADKPSGIDMGDFLPDKFRSLSTSNSYDGGGGGGSGSKFSAYSNYIQQPSDLSEREVTSAIQKGHQSMMAALTTRGRNMEIIHKMWQNKDAKAAVDQAVSYNDQAVLSDLLSVITLRPSIWNLDLCTALLPPIGDLLQSKYEMYITVGCGAMKLILKNFGSVIKTNIDSPVTMGVDISREERHNKCMQAYKDLVKIRALILKRQTMPGKLGHTYRELSILMQYLD